MPWAIKWRSENCLDGKKHYLVGRYMVGNPDVPPHVAGYTKMVFRTRKAAREHIKKHYGYIRNQPDLRAEPHGWKMPKVVKVAVIVEEID